MKSLSFKLRPIGFFLITPFSLLMVVNVFFLAFMPNEPEFPKTMAFALWGVVSFFLSLICAFASVPVFLHHPVAESFNKRLCWVAGLGGVVTCGVVMLVFQAMKEMGRKPSMLWVLMLLPISTATMELLLVICFKLKWLRSPPKVGFCECCGYDLRASRLICPECGAEIQASAV